MTEIVSGAQLDDAKAAASPGAWFDPLSYAMHGGPSWYEGGQWGMFNNIHAVDNPMNHGAEIHNDPFGPMNQPAHFLFQVLTNWLGIGNAQYDSISCSSSGCAVGGGH